MVRLLFVETRSSDTIVEFSMYYKLRTRDWSIIIAIGKWRWVYEPGTSESIKFMSTW